MSLLSLNSLLVLFIDILFAAIGSGLLLDRIVPSHLLSPVCKSVKRVVGLCVFRTGHLEKLLVISAVPDI